MPFQLFLLLPLFLNKLCLSVFAFFTQRLMLRRIANQPDEHEFRIQEAHLNYGNSGYERNDLCKWLVIKILQQIFCSATCSAKKSSGNRFPPAPGV